MEESEDGVNGQQSLPGQVRPQTHGPSVQSSVTMSPPDSEPVQGSTNPPKRKGNAANNQKLGKGKKKSDRNKQSEENLDWDCAEEKPMHGANDDEGTCWSSFTKFGLVVSAIFLFIVVFGCACLSRIIIHIMIWRLNPPFTNNNFTVNKLGGTLKPQLDRMRLKCEHDVSGNCRAVGSGLPESWECVEDTANQCLLFEETPSVNVGWVWSLLLVMSAPYFYVILVSFWRICFKKVEQFEHKMFLVSLVVELTHSTGLCLMVFLVMPAFDPVSASTLPFFVGFLPTLLSLKFQVKRDIDKKVIKTRIANAPPKENGGPTVNNQQSPPSTDEVGYSYMEMPILGGILFLTGFIFLCIYVYFSSESKNFIKILVLMIISVLLVSLSWWENFVTSNIKPKSEKRNSFLKTYIKSKRETVSVPVYSIKIAWQFLVTLIIYVSQSDGSTLNTARTFLYLEDSANVSTLSGNILLESGSYIPYGCWTLNPYMMALTCLILTFAFFKTSRYACRVVLQRKCFAVPIVLNLSLIPLIFVILMKYPLAFTAAGCNVLQPLWEIDFDSSVERVWPLIVAGTLGFVSMVILTSYIWSTGGSKMEKVERLFRKPPYCGIFLDMSLLLSRKRIIDSYDFITERKTDDKPSEVYSPMVYFCATMWHETENEMTQLLKSLFRVDMDQCWRRQDQALKQQQRRGYFDEDIYDFEVHIFFDDAFKPRILNGKPRKSRFVNEYVKLLEDCVPKTAKSIYGDYELEPVQKFETPYGMKYVWNMLTDKTKLIVHLKDKQKIRHRKRWSQVMYMYYLLTFELNKHKSNLEDKKEWSKSMPEIVQILSQNTFLLALDGDVDFKPEAVTLLLDLMRKNADVGAACGRIHPIGSGPMVWYQKFEYAVSHWLQKATEHVIGCVLCSPGCFSLFRGSSVLADNVLKTYTRQATEAEQHIQYDQGEDRWLCTLMLKEGFRVEYCAASDALTFAPEGFFEFYKQRRRWAPSTMANILDLLLDWKYVKKNNDSISMLYIIYHIFLFVSSLLTPGTIFLLIMGAIITAFPNIEPWLALVLNMLPVAVLIVSIFVAKEDTQLMLAGIISTIYSLVMMVVLIGLVKEGVDSKFCSVTTVFFCFVAGVFVTAAFIHPKEFTCIFHGLLYFLAVPSMSMLLILYSIGNMHNINWGTRENKSATAQGMVVNRKRRFEGQTCSIGEWCRCMLCVREIEEPTPIEDTDDLENASDDEKPQGQPNKEDDVQKTSTPPEETPVMDANKPAKANTGGKDKTKRGDFKNSLDLPEDERVFWAGLIKKYLKPVDIKPAEKERIGKELEELRNKVFFFVFIINALFVTIVYVLTQVNAYQGTLEIPLPCSVGDKQGKIEPISIAFTLTFGILLVIQFFGMIYHRVSTFTHIIASTRLDNQVHIRRPKLKEAETAALATDQTENSTSNDGMSSHKSKANTRWNKVKCGVYASTAIRTISGEIKKRPQKLQSLRTKMTEMLTEESIREEEKDDICKKYPDTPVTIQSVRRTGDLPPLIGIRNNVGDDMPGTSKA